MARSALTSIIVLCCYHFEHFCRGIPDQRTFYQNHSMDECFLSDSLLPLLPPLCTGSYEETPYHFRHVTHVAPTLTPATTGLQRKSDRRRHGIPTCTTTVPHSTTGGYNQTPCHHRQGRPDAATATDLLPTKTGMPDRCYVCGNNTTDVFTHIHESYRHCSVSIGIANTSTFTVTTTDPTKGGQPGVKEEKKSTSSDELAFLISENRRQWTVLYILAFVIIVVICMKHSASARTIYHQLLLVYERCCNDESTHMPSNESGMPITNHTVDEHNSCNLAYSIDLDQHNMEQTTLTDRDSSDGYHYSTSRDETTPKEVFDTNTNQDQVFIPGNIKIVQHRP